MADELGYLTAEEIAKLKVFPETEETDGPASSEGYVYLVKEVGTNNFKSGRTADPKRRLRDLQTGNSNELEMIPVKVSDMAACEKRLLQEMKGQFEPTGGGKEWFTGDLEEARRVFHKVAGHFK